MPTPRCSHGPAPAVPEIAESVAELPTRLKKARNDFADLAGPRLVDPVQLRVLPPMSGQEGSMTMATRKRHTPEQVVRKLAHADRLLGEGKGNTDATPPPSTGVRRRQFGSLDGAIP
jgi:hypothetical protein